MLQYIILIPIIIVIAIHKLSTGFHLAVANQCQILA